MDSSFALDHQDLVDEALFVGWPTAERRNVFDKLQRKGYTLTQLSQLLAFDLPTLSEIKSGRVKPNTKIYLQLHGLANKRTNLLIKHIRGRSSGWTQVLNPYISPQLLGLIHTDGILRYAQRRAEVRFYNKERSLCRLFARLLRETFHTRIHQRVDRRNGTHCLIVPAVVARILWKKFGGKTSHGIPVPRLSDAEVAPYLRGVLDGDGCVMWYENHRFHLATITLCAGSKEYADTLARLLLRLGIPSRQRHEKRGNGEWWTVVITRQEAVLRFIRLIGSDHPKKRVRMEWIRAKLTSGAKCPLSSQPSSLSALQSTAQD